jgi:hypothetical protein
MGCAASARGQSKYEADAVKVIGNEPLSPPAAAGSAAVAAEKKGPDTSEPPLPDQIPTLPLDLVKEWLTKLGIGHSSADSEETLRKMLQSYLVQEEVKRYSEEDVTKILDRCKREEDRGEDDGDRKWGILLDGIAIVMAAPRPYASTVADVDRSTTAESVRSVATRNGPGWQAKDLLRIQKTLQEIGYFREQALQYKWHFDYNFKLSLLVRHVHVKFQPFPPDGQEWTPQVGDFVLARGDLEQNIDPAVRDPNWAWVQNPREGVQGWVQANCLETVHGTVAREDFDSDDVDENGIPSIRMRAGMVMEIRAQDPRGLWTYVASSEENVGWVPATSLEPLPDETVHGEIIAELDLLVETATQQEKKLQALLLQKPRDVTADIEGAEAELENFAMRTNALVEKLQKEAAQNEADTQAVESQIGRVVAPFEAESEIQLSVNVGDVLIIVQRDESGWTYCRRDENDEGWVPRDVLAEDFETAEVLSPYDPGLKDSVAG